MSDDISCPHKHNSKDEEANEAVELEERELRAAVGDEVLPEHGVSHEDRRKELVTPT